MPRVVGDLIAPELARVLSHHDAVLRDVDALGIGMNVDRPPDGLGGDRVLVAIEAHEAGLGDRGADGVEAVEGAAIRHEDRPLGLQHLEDRLLLLLRMSLRLRVGDALVGEPPVEIVERLEDGARREEPLADHTHLVLDLSLLPARRRRARGGLDQMVAHQPLEAVIELALLADEHSIDRRLHVVVDAPPRHPLEELERLLMGVEDHLLRLAQVGPHEQHAAVTQSDLRHLHGDGHAVENDDLVAPVELVGFARPEREWYVGL